MSSDQQRGTKAAQDAQKQGNKVDFNKMTPGERDAALTEQNRQNKK